MKRVAAISAVFLLAAFAAVQTARLWTLQKRAPGTPSSPAAAVPPSLPDAGLATSDGADPTQDGENGVADVQTPSDNDAAFGERLVAQAIETMMAEAAAADAMRGAHPAESRGHAAVADAESAEDEHAKATGAQRTRHLLSRAKEALLTGDFEAAARMLAQSLELDPQNRQAYRALAEMHQSLGRMEDEMRVLQDWAGAIPGDAMPHYLLSRAYERMGLDAEAYSELQLFETLSSGSLPAYPMLAEMYHDLGRRAEERQTLQDWTRAAPGSPDAHHALAQYYRSAGNYAAAARQYEHLAALTPQNASVYAEMAAVYRQMNMFAEAEASYLQALELQPNSPGVLFQLGNLYRASGDYYAALDAYQGVIDAAPNSQQARQAARAIQRLQNQLANPGAQQPSTPKPKRAVLAFRN